MKLVILIILAGTFTFIFPQNKFRNAVLLTHSSGSRLYDYDAYMGTDSGATTVPIQTGIYNTNHNYTGEDSCWMEKRWFPVVYGTDWINWLYCFRNEIGDGSNIYEKIDSFDIVILKGGIQTCNMTGYGSYADTSGAGVSNKTTINYKWIWREMVKVMDNYPNKFFVIMTGSASGDENNTPTGAALAHAFAVWATDTLALGYDEVIGNFPPNIYVFDYFHYLADNEYYLKDHYESGYQGQYQDDHPNATACNDIAPIFVQEVYDAAIAYETTIPVELISFTASVVPTGVELNWSTATELNNDKFEIQKKAENGEFIVIGFVKGQSTSTSTTDYFYIDKNTNSGKYLYRLKQIDFDGNYKYSKVVEVDFNPVTNYSLEQNYPNPFNPSTQINYTLAKSRNITLKIYDSLGSEVVTLVNEFKESGKHSVKFEPKKLNSGVYFYRLETDSFTATRKMLLIK